MKITIDAELKEELEENDMWEGHTFLNGDPNKEKFWERMSDITGHPPDWLEEVWGCGDDIDFVVVEDGEEYGQLIFGAWEGWMH